MTSPVRTLRKIARSWLPKSARNRLKYFFDADYRMRADWKKDRAMGKLVHEQTGGRIVGGPFKGLLYVDSAMGSTIGPKLLGTYEKELFPIIEQIISQPYTLLLNIGAGEGYYAVGLATRMLGARIVCFEALEKNRAQIRKLADFSGVGGRIVIHGLCTAELLAEVLLPPSDGRAGDKEKTLIICDVEGAEVEILRPDQVPALRHADLLVEMHDIIRRGISAIIRGRFQASHEIDVIPTARRTAADWPDGVHIDPAQRAAGLSEQGGRMTWFWMKAQS